MQQQAGLPRNMPEVFLKAFLDWQNRLNSLTYGEEVKVKAKELTFEKLLQLIGPKWQPALYSELYLFAVNELAERQLTVVQRDLVRAAWSKIKHICIQANDSQFKIIWTGAERRIVSRLLGPNYLK